MHISMRSRLGWHDEDVATEHDIRLKFTVDVTDIFVSSDPVSELTVRGAEIRKMMVMLLANENLVQMLAGTKRPIATEGHLTTDTDMEWEAKWSFLQRPRGNPMPRLQGEVLGRIKLTTNRSVHPIQALECARGLVADGIAELMMGPLHYNLHGTSATSSHTEYDVKKGQVANVETEVRKSDEHLQN
jgi:hypothetical protein